ncbi:MAG: hypothetical protein GX595_16925, partial [Lentisphaerae bacterium]|nr:hypothetical protein [Lentisphaerota bacterium]
MRPAVDVVPYAARVLEPRPGEVEIWWEDPRDLHRVEVVFAQPVTRDGLPLLAYWQRSWPGVRVARNATVGAGDEGWLAMDDWITGQWREAMVDIEGDGGTWSYTFRSLDEEAIPHAGEFPVCFRRTLKLRLQGGANGPAVERVHAYTDSEWREVDVCLEWGGIASSAQVWDGHLEVFNGTVAGVAALTGDCQVPTDDSQVLPNGSWRSRTSGLTAGVRARIRYAWNDDANSFDRTTLTLRFASQPAISVDLNAVAAGETVYLPDFGIAVASAVEYPGLASLRSGWEARRGKTTWQRVAELPEQTWERAWAEMPGKGRLYFVLGCEGGRQKFRLEPNGDLVLPENFIRRVPGRDTGRLLWEGQVLAMRFGLPEPETRQLLDGYLPIMRTEWTTEPIVVRQEAFATWLVGDIADATEKQGDDTVVALVRLTFRNDGPSPGVARLSLSTADGGGEEDLQVEDGLIYTLCGAERRLRLSICSSGRGTVHRSAHGLIYEEILLPGEERAVILKVPFITLSEPSEIQVLEGIHFDTALAQVAAFWRGRVAQGMLIETPNPELNRFHKA